jgi:hypothetical protein
MGANIWFWLIYVLVGIFGLFGFSSWGARTIPPWGSWLILFILVGILGWHDFGPPIR